MSNAGYVDVQGGRLYHEIDGDGPAVLLIPGGLGNLRMWDAQVPALAERYTVIRYDPRGFGRSETEHVPFSDRADAAAVLEHAGVTSAHVVGQSRGGIVALDLTLDRPALARSLVLVAGGASGYQPQLPDGVEGPPWDEMERLWEQKEWATLAELETRVWVDGWGQPPTRVDPELRRRVHGDILATYQAEKEEGEPQGLKPPAVGRLAEVRVPTLVVIGTVDEPGGNLNSRFVAQAIPGARLVEFDGVAHMIHMEQPDRFNGLLLDFVAEAEAAAVR